MIPPRITPSGRAPCSTLDGYHASRRASGRRRRRQVVNAEISLDRRDLRHDLLEAAFAEALSFFVFELVAHGLVLARGHDLAKVGEEYRVLARRVGFVHVIELADRGHEPVRRALVLQ